MYWPVMLMGSPPQDGSKIAWRPQNAFPVSPPQRPMYGAAMIERKAALLRLYPTPQQASQMAQIAGACRFVYNLALEQRRDWYRAGRTFTFAGQCRELTQLRAAAGRPPIHSSHISTSLRKQPRYDFLPHASACHGHPYLSFRA